MAAAVGLPRMGVNCACGNGNDELDVVMAVAARAGFAWRICRLAIEQMRVDDV